MLSPILRIGPSGSRRALRRAGLGRGAASPAVFVSVSAAVPVPTVPRNLRRFVRIAISLRAVHRPPSSAAGAAWLASGVVLDTLTSAGLKDFRGEAAGQGLRDPDRTCHHPRPWTSNTVLRVSPSASAPCRGLSAWCRRRRAAGRDRQPGTFRFETPAKLTVKSSCAIGMKNGDVLVVMTDAPIDCAAAAKSADPQDAVLNSGGVAARVHFTIKADGKLGPVFLANVAGASTYTDDTNGVLKAGPKTPGQHRRDGDQRRRQEDPALSGRARHGIRPDLQHADPEGGQVADPQARLIGHRGQRDGYRSLPRPPQGDRHAFLPGDQAVHRSPPHRRLPVGARRPSRGRARPVRPSSPTAAPTSWSTTTRRRAWPVPTPPRGGRRSASGTVITAIRLRPARYASIFGCDAGLHPRRRRPAVGPRPRRRRAAPAAARDRELRAPPRAARGLGAHRARPERERRSARSSPPAGCWRAGPRTSRSARSPAGSTGARARIHRQFRAACGYGPKHFQRIMRVQQAMRAVH